MKWKNMTENETVSEKRCSKSRPRTNRHSQNFSASRRAKNQKWGRKISFVLIIMIFNDQFRADFEWFAIHPHPHNISASWLSDVVARSFRICFGHQPESQTQAKSFSSGFFKCAKHVSLSRIIEYSSWNCQLELWPNYGVSWWRERELWEIEHSIFFTLNFIIILNSNSIKLYNLCEMGKSICIVHAWFILKRAWGLSDFEWALYVMWNW